MPRILLVEDDPFISEIYTKKLESSGFEVVPALTGREGLKKARDGVYDLVLLDLVIPEVSGMDVLREFRNSREFDPNLKVVIFSNLSGPQERQEALSIGANGFILKTDFSPAEVVTEIKRYLNQFSAQGAHAERRADATTSTETPSTPGLSATPAASETAGAPHILFIEDEPVFIEMFSKALQNLGYTVVTERNGRSGLERARAEQFDLIITDHLLPSMSGKEVIMALRADERMKSVPIFLLTASLDEEEVKSLETSGAVNRSFLKIRVVPSELADIVQEFFSNR